MKRLLLTNALIVTGEKSASGSILIEGGRIAAVVYADEAGAQESLSSIVATKPEAVDLGGKMLFAGGIDAHVHFREPGMTWKADMESESKAALAGGVTSFMDMPNTRPATTSIKALEDKLATAAEKSYANYAFHLGATNENMAEIEEACGTKSAEVAGIKVFMGSSTGNMLVDSPDTLSGIFSIKGKPVLVHCEDEETIKRNTAEAVAEYGDGIPMRMHAQIRSRQACIKSTVKALEMAMKCGTRLHLLHVSTKEEAEMVRAAKALNPLITAETSGNYLWFCEEDYDRLGSRVKCNPSVKTAEDRAALRQALAEGIIDTTGSDHAPHTQEEKQGCYTEVPSGMPSIQHTLPLLLSIAEEAGISFTRIASAFSERAAEIFRIQDRGRLAKGCYADLCVVEKKRVAVEKAGLMSKCGWSPYEGEEFGYAVHSTYINGELAYHEGRVAEERYAGELKFL